MRVTNKFTTALAVVPTATSKDGALEALQSALASAANRTLDSRHQAISFVEVDEDPDLVRQKKEQEMKEKLRKARAQEKNEMKERERATRRSGGGVRSTGYGLSIGALEDEEGGKRSGVRKPKPKTGLRRDWSDDEDYGPGRGRTNREDEYDEEDDFIAASDEEEVVEDDDDEDDGIMDSPPRRGESPKRSRTQDDEVVVSRTKRRRVVDDDDEDE